MAKIKTLENEIEFMKEEATWVVLGDDQDDWGSTQPDTSSAVCSGSGAEDEIACS